MPGDAVPARTDRTDRGGPIGLCVWLGRSHGNHGDDNKRSLLPINRFGNRYISALLAMGAGQKSSAPEESQEKLMETYTKRLYQLLNKGYWPETGRRTRARGIQHIQAHHLKGANHGMVTFPGHFAYRSGRFHPTGQRGIGPHGTSLLGTGGNVFQ